MALPPLSTTDPLTRRLHDPYYDTWRAKVQSTGGCLNPVHLSGRWAITDATTGAELTSTQGQIMAPCGNRRESVCPACSDRYAADAFHLLRAGLAGGSKGVPEDIAGKPRLFVTLTAPSFGPVHNRPATKTGKPRPCRCGTRHHEADSRLGQPTDPESYDYTGHVLWQAHASKLWHRFTIALRRHLAQAAGLRVREFGEHARLSYAKVAEFQRRGLIHFHAVIRLDGPAGPEDETPVWATTTLVTEAVRGAHRDARLPAPEIDGQAREFTWGEQLDVRPVQPADAGQFEEPDGAISDDRIASYVAKYATKGTGKSEAADRRLRSRSHIELIPTSQHHRRIMRTAWDLAENDELAELKLRHWAHMLAFRGHFLTKSKRYSTTFKRLRGDRQRFRFEENLAELDVDEESVLVVNHWEMTHIGHRSDEERELAEAIGNRTRELRKLKYVTERKD
ncbi:replication initiator [Bounagaea algeriensis]